MSRRESILEVNLQQWRGVDQRTQPTLVQNGFFVMTRGTYFGLGGNCERIPGKKLAGVIDEPIVNIVQFGQIAILQTLSNVYTVTVEELMDFNLNPYDSGIQDQDAEYIRDENNGIIRDTVI